MNMNTGQTITDLMALADRVIAAAAVGTCWYETEFGGCPEKATISSLVAGEEGMQFCSRCWRRLHR